MPEPDPTIPLHDRPEQEPTLEGAFSEDGVDLTLIHWMLERTPAERLAAVQDINDAAGALSAGE
jgi:hypothetical protein